MEGEDHGQNPEKTPTLKKHSEGRRRLKKELSKKVEGKCVIK
jgi:hypothetical protein